MNTIKLVKEMKISISASLCLFLLSCSASTHVGKETIVEPLSVNENENAWFQYYEDQFDAKEGIVKNPDSTYSKTAFMGYEKAKIEWDRKVKISEKNTVLIYCGIGAVNVTVLYMIYHDLTSKPFYHYTEPAKALVNDVLWN